MVRKKFLTFLTLTAYCHHVTAFNILAIASQPFKSHYMVFGPLFRELAKRGHNVTVINNYPDEVPTKNLTFINLNCSPLKYGTAAVNYENINSDFHRILNAYRHIALGQRTTKDDCRNLLTHKDVVDHLAKGIKYDVIFVEQFMGDCGLAYAATMYDGPIIGITSHVLLPWTYTRMGIPFNVPADAFYFSSAGTNPTLYHKVETQITNWFLTTFAKWFIHGVIDEVFKEHLPNATVDIDKIAKERMKMIFAYQHFSLTGTRVMSQQILEIGGLHIREPKPLSEKLEKFLLTAEHGAIYVSFGSNVKSNSMSKAKLQQFLNAFEKIPQKVIWKWEGDSLLVDNDKMFTQAWLPQIDILCHPKVLAFVSHGGMLSLSETAYCGKPLITIPFFGDQFTNSAVANQLGLGKMLFFSELNTETLVAAIKELTSQKMQETAKKVKSLWRDRPQPAMESAIYWTEYVARHRDSPSHLPSLNNTWLEELQLDVFIIILALLISLLLILYIILRIVLKIIIYLVFKIVKGNRKKDKTN